MNLRFDDDIKINLAADPGTCPASELSGKTIAQAYEQCGPGADGNPAARATPTCRAAGNVSGVGSTTARGSTPAR